MLSLGLDLWSSTILGRGGADLYAVLGLSPALVFDFAAEKYRTGGSSTTFSDAITYTGASNKTMVDSDGLLKWAPHNLCLHSGDLTASGWAFLTGATVSGVKVADPFGGATADELSFSASANSLIYRADTSYINGFNYKVAGWVRAKSGTEIFRFRANTVISNFSSSNLTATTDWQLFEFEFTADNTVSNGQTSIRNGTDAAARTIEVFGVHTYRSDLGGMVNNPDTGNSYVPTTSAAVYLPRRGHHVYNGSAWVNEGLLVESEQRVNLEDYSNLTTGWTSGDVTKLAAQETGPDGNLSLSSITVSATTAAHQIFSTVTVTSGATFCQSFFVKAGTQRYVGLRELLNASTWAAVTFDLQDKVVTDTQTASATVVSSGVEDFGGGLLRIHMASTIAGRSTAYLVLEAVNSATPTRAISGFGVNSYLGAGEVFYAGLAQGEAGSTPSSYIPTSGQQRTREAETLTVAAADLPYPTPRVIGPELVTNGTFDTDSDWTKGASWAITGGEAVKSGVGTDAIYQELTSLQVGKVYEITWTQSWVTNPPSLLLRVGSSGAVVYNSAASGQGEQSVVFTAPNTLLRINFYFNGSTSTGTFDNISVREIDPLAVSIQMQGRMTYADENLTNQHQFVRWRLDANNRIETYLSTSVGTGFIGFQQAALSVADNVNSSTTAYAPDVNVPFNIASRHGSTFINGAVDGTALTVDTDPVALPALSATNLSLAYDYMGTIRLYRMWDQDLADAGIAAASAPSLEPSLSLLFDGSEGSFTVDDWSE